MRSFVKAMCVGIVLSGCVAALYYPYYYDNVYYDPYWYYYDGYFVYTWVDPYGTYYYYSYLQEGAPGTHAQSNIDLTSVAKGFAAAANTQYTPAGCVNAIANGASVAYDFANCTGSDGIRSINGKMTSQLSQNEKGQLVITTTSDGLQINGGAFIVDSVTTVDSVGPQRVATVTSRSRSPDRVDSRNAQMTITWQQGNPCLQISGQDTDSKGSDSATTTLDGYQRCAEQCPRAGAVEVVGHGADYFGDFDGSNKLKVTVKNGPSRMYDLQCQ